MTGLTAERLKQTLSYDADTGAFTHLYSRGRNTVGQIAGCPVGRGGHLRIGIDKQLYYAHRLAWLYVYGAWPDGALDHINCDPADNRIANLRIATKQQNMANTRARNGVKGAYWYKRRSKWASQIQVSGRFFHLGYFNTQQEAHEAYAKAAREHFGEFARAS